MVHTLTVALMGRNGVTTIFYVRIFEIAIPSHRLAVVLVHRRPFDLELLGQNVLVVLQFLTHES